MVPEPALRRRFHVGKAVVALVEVLGSNGIESCADIVLSVASGVDHLPEDSEEIAVEDTTIVNTLLGPGFLFDLDVTDSRRVQVALQDTIARCVRRCWACDRRHFLLALPAILAPPSAIAHSSS